MSRDTVAFAVSVAAAPTYLINVGGVAADAGRPVTAVSASPVSL